MKMNGRSLSKAWFCVAAVAVLLALWPLSDTLAQDQSPPQSTSRGENFSAKPPAQLFASDCTGAGCHKGPQGLGRGQFPGSLANFLREHYTNSRESAAALAGYLSNIPRGAATEPRTPRSGKPAATATAPTSALPNWGEGAESKPAPGEARPPRSIPVAGALAPPRGPTRIPLPPRRLRRSPRRQRLSLIPPPEPSAAVTRPRLPRRRLRRPRRSQRWRPHLRPRRRRRRNRSSSTSSTSVYS